MIHIREDDLEGAPTRALLALHLSGIQSDSAPGHATALDLSGLRQPDITVWTAWDGEAVLGIGALKVLGDGTGEVKSMRTDPRHLRRGVGAAILDHIIAAARRQGLHRLSLQTAFGAAFEPAVALYQNRGFADGAAFGDYPPGAPNRFLHLAL